MSSSDLTSRNSEEEGLSDCDEALDEVKQRIKEAFDILKRETRKARKEKRSLDKVAKKLEHVHFSTMVQLNVGGHQFSTSVSTMNRDPGTVLLKLSWWSGSEKGFFRIPSEKELIYKINCSDLQASYIGDTGRNLTTRLTEHRRATKKGNVSNHIAEHHRLINHNIDWDSAQCLTYSTDYFQRLTLECWFTNLEKTPLNRCQQLPALYKRLIHDINITNDEKERPNFTDRSKQTNHGRLTSLESYSQEHHGKTNRSFHTNWNKNILLTTIIQLTLMMTSAQVVETSVTTTDNSPFQDYTHPDDQTTPSHVTPGFKPFTA
ncbi:hypothetical protein AWC38_SpisGene17451 [Stylophora pistillata]|uniref:GIY-YIG domain-containing protein n=1 Tax=Stylophora pistillata TaxID=50429 RepID=A0A2B4RPD4_STYPI|nr:hypothetical protein AWC38_SpisGene17451 [Stylophora pistillata]